jgi:hypothetical protein
LRGVLKPVKEELRHELNEPAAQDQAEKRETACVVELEPATLGRAEVLAEALAAAPPLPPPPGIRKESPVLPVPAPAPSATGFWHHLGVLFFSAVLLGVEKQVVAGGWLLKQWLATLLLEAINIEQTKLLDFEDLHRLLA